MTITYHPEMVQGSDEWMDARRGVLCASEVCKILTPTLKIAANNDERAHVYELAAQRITGYTEPHYISDDMLRGQAEEIEARALYSKKYATVTEVGFVTNDEFGFVLGCSPDGLVGDDGGVEFKSRRQRFQIETIVKGAVPAEFMMQIQTCMLVTRRKWWDFGSYSGGLPFPKIRVTPNRIMQLAIIEAATAFEARVAAVVAAYQTASVGLPATERTIRAEDDMFIGEE